MIAGFTCVLEDDRLRKCVESVLAQIQNAHPGDFRALKRLLVRVAPHPAPEPADLAECCKANPNGREFQDDAVVGAQRVVFLVEEKLGECDDLSAKAHIAHELGHVLATSDQRDRAEVEMPFDDPETVGEGLADLYALRWGYEDALREVRASRCSRHHPLSADDLLPFVKSIDNWQSEDEVFEQLQAEENTLP